jgi:TPR repeat protein
MRQRVRTLFAGGVLMLALLGGAMAGPVEDGWSAYGRGDFATALQLLRPLADQGNAEAQAGLGAMYETNARNNLTSPQDYVQGIVWLLKAANQGNASAQEILGYMYQNGEGVPQDHMQAAAWFLKAANQGVANPQALLGHMYDVGQGVPQDYVKAVAWYRKAANQGDAWAQSRLGFMYAGGHGVPLDGVLAYMWLNLAAPGSTDPATRTLRDLIGSKITPEQLAEAQRMTREWKPK